MDGSNVPAIAATAPATAPATTPATTPATQQIDVEKTVGNYVRLRDKIDEIAKKHEAELEPYKVLRRKLDGMLLQHLNETNTKSCKTGAGTITATTRSSASVQDTEAFRKFIIENDEWDLVDIKANAPAVFKYLEDEGQPVPGVKTSQMQTLSVRRS